MIEFENCRPEAEPATITRLDDKRLIKIDPQEKGFFDIIINFRSENGRINDFIDPEEDYFDYDYSEESRKNRRIKEFISDILEVIDVKVGYFYKPIYDPTEYGNTIAFQRERKPAVGHSFKWWQEIASKMPSVEGKKWKVANQYQYYCFLVWLINQLVKSGKSVEEALNMVVNNSKELGNYFDSDHSTQGNEYELTGSRCVCGVCDLANTFKIIALATKQYGGQWFGLIQYKRGCWVAGGDYESFGVNYPLASLDYCQDSTFDNSYSVGLLILL